MRTPLSLALVFGLLSPSAAGAFFDVLDEMQAELGGTASVEETSIDELLQGLSITEESLVFTDVDENAWYAAYVSAVADWGIASGYKDAQGNATGEFGPGNSVTVAEMLKMSLRAAGIDEEECPDSPERADAKTHWSARFVACAETIHMRVFDTRVDLDRPATRAEVLVIIHDSFGDSVPYAVSTFSDTIDHSYEADIAYAASLGIVSGDTNVDGSAKGTFRPNDGVNRAEAAKVIYQKLKTQLLLEEAGEEQ
ncbi:MAG: S-layer homology domain-containing protein [Candidatus Peregrinibacteria bacterium]|nr:S-layer homology domain-containing protein [Candidatus Peregrinibacteria bacterium]